MKFIILVLVQLFGFLSVVIAIDYFKKEENSFIGRLLTAQKNKRPQQDGTGTGTGYSTTESEDQLSAPSVSENTVKQSASASS